jgi:hypothetical protein
MSTEENKAIARRWFEAHSSQEDVERAADELLSPHFVDHIPPFQTFMDRRATNDSPQEHSLLTPMPGSSLKS